METINYK